MYITTISSTRKMFPGTVEEMSGMEVVLLSRELLQ